MSEAFWKHRFVETLWRIIRIKAGLSDWRCFDIAQSLVDSWFIDHSSYKTPEAAAEMAFQHLCI